MSEKFKGRVIDELEKLHPGCEVIQLTLPVELHDDPQWAKAISEAEEINIADIFPVSD